MNIHLVEHLRHKMNNKELLWDKGSTVYEEFKADLAKKYNMPTKTITPRTNVLEDFACFSGKKLYKSLITEYLIAVDIVEHYSGFRLK